MSSKVNKFSQRKTTDRDVSSTCSQMALLLQWKVSVLPSGYLGAPLHQLPGKHHRAALWALQGQFLPAGVGTELFSMWMWPCWWEKTISSPSSKLLDGCVLQLMLEFPSRIHQLHLWQQGAMLLQRRCHRRQMQPMLGWTHWTKRLQTQVEIIKCNFSQEKNKKGFWWNRTRFCVGCLAEELFRSTESCNNVGK